MAWSKDYGKAAKVAADRAEAQADRAELASDYLDAKQPLIDEFTSEQTNLQTQLNDLVLQSGTDIAEVVQARGGFATVNDRLLDTSAQLAEKGNQIEDIMISVKSFGAKGDGVTNDTIAIKNAYAYSKNLYFPNTGNPYLINVEPNGRFLFLEDYTTLKFQEGAALKLIANNLPAYAVIYGLNKKGIKIINPTIIGDRDTHTGTTGESGNGIQLLGCTDAVVINPRISKCWGDGLIIGSGEYEAGGKYYCENVHIDGGELFENRRNNLSLISAKGFLMDRTVIANANGTSPQAGIDIEPNAPTDYLQGVVFRDVKTKNSVGNGIEINLMNYNNSVNPIDVVIENHQDEGSKSNFVIIGYTETKGIAKTKGLIKIINPRWSKPTTIHNFLARGTYADGVRIELHTPKATPITGGYPYTVGDLGFPVGTPASNEVVGNVHFYNSQVETENGILPAADIMFDRRIHKSFKNISIIDPISVKKKIYMNPSDFENLVITDASNVMRLDSAVSVNIDIYDLKRTYTNKGATGTVVFTITEFNVGQEATFINETGTRIGIKFPAGKVVYPTNTNLILGDLLGSKLSVKKIASGNYVITQQIGAWVIS